MPVLHSKSSLAPGQFPLKPGSNRVGRAAGNDIVLNHPSVSGRHAEIVVEGESILVRDLGSTNGTFIDRQPVQESFIRSGQTLHFGGMEIVCVATENQPAAAPASTTPDADSQTMIMTKPAPKG